MLNLRTGRIEAPHLILCEGPDAAGFLSNYLYQWDKERCREVEVASFGGNKELPIALRALRVTEGFSDLRLMLIVRDAEINTAAAVQVICSVLKACRYMAPARESSL